VRSSPLPRVRGIVFDLDGTLVDSLTDITASLNHALARWRLPAKDPAWMRLNVGQGAAFLVAQAVAGTSGEDRQAEILAAFVAHYEAHPCPATFPYPGVPEALADCHARGLTLAVLSNKPAGIVVRVVDAMGWRPWFRYVWGGDSFPEHKPSPLPLRHFMMATGLAPEEVLMVGDSSADVLCARNADARCAFFPGGYGRLDGTGLTADFTLASMGDLPALLDHFSRRVRSQE
jgi:phosphoglycolate phosphatase